MARLMSQVKGGFYAAAPEAVAAVLERLRPPAAGEIVIFDPCAGEGRALLQLAHGLRAVPYGIELSEDRAATVRDSLRGGQGHDEGGLEILSLVKTKTPKIEIHRDAPRTDAHFRRLFAVVREYIDGLDSGRLNYWPSFACGMCDHRDLCAGWSG